MKTIDKNIPIPKSLNAAGQRICRVYPLDKLEPGDSMSAPNLSAATNLRVSMIHYGARRGGWTVKQRKLQDGSYRIWRIA